MSGLCPQSFPTGLSGHPPRAAFLLLPWTDVFFHQMGPGILSFSSLFTPKALNTHEGCRGRLWKWYFYIISKVYFLILDILISKQEWFERGNFMLGRKKTILLGYFPSFLKTTWQLCEPAEECGAIVFNIGKVVFSTADAVLGLSQNPLSYGAVVLQGVVSNTSMAQWVVEWIALQFTVTISLV